MLLANSYQSLRFAIAVVTALNLFDLILHGFLHYFMDFFCNNFFIVVALPTIAISLVCVIAMIFPLLFAIGFKRVRKTIAIAVIIVGRAIQKNSN